MLVFKHRMSPLSLRKLLEESLLCKVCFERIGFCLGIAVLGGSYLKHCLETVQSCSSTKIWVFDALRLLVMQSEW